MENFEAVKDKEIKNKPEQNKSRRALALRNIRELGVYFVLGTSMLMGRIGWDEYGEYKETQRIEVFKSGEIEKKDIKTNLSLIETNDKEYKMSAEHLRETLLETYPLSWIDNISSISQSVEAPRPDSRYGEEINKHSTTIASCRKNFLSAKSEIIFYSKANLSSLQEVDEVLSHELGHAYQFSLATNKEELDQKIKQRLTEDDRYFSSYVETIVNKNKQIEEEAREREYWAEIVKQFFTDASELNIKDFQIVASEIAKTDPSLNWAEAKERLDDIILRAYQEQGKIFVAIENFNTQDEIRNDKLLIAIEFKYAGHHYRANLEGGKEFVGSKVELFRRSDGFVCYRKAGVGSSGKYLSFFFKPGPNSRVSIYQTSTGEKITEINAIS